MTVIKVIRRNTNRPSSAVRGDVPTKHLRHNVQNDFGDAGNNDKERFLIN
jgi:hypothetical protein